MIRMQPPAPPVKEVMTMNKDDLRTDLVKMEPQFKVALPGHIAPDLVTRTVTTEVSKNPKILDCTKESIFLAVTEACQMGLIPDSVQGLSYLVPFNKKCTLIPGYRGLITLVRQSGLVKSIHTSEIKENDVVSIEKGTAWRMHHPIDITKDRGKTIGYYASAILPGGVVDFEVMSESEVDEFLGKIGKKGSEVWKQWREEMAKKTCIRKLCKRLPTDPSKPEHTRLAAAMEYAEDNTVGMRFNQKVGEWMYQTGDPDAAPSTDDLNERAEIPEVSVKSV